MEGYVSAILMKVIHIYLLKNDVKAMSFNIKSHNRNIIRQEEMSVLTY